ncbi:hypothetical protein [Acinetobacter bohemicus]|uniref:hypothetical protein n=1 Tax=Acinetobacter bohemicus TaxID=1435036 RepID=UPI00192B7C39|nr:hypothetical protein [Acinetobacter bohemicus]CAD9196852.1 hypothetical protein QAC21B_03016 [Acinetobacter bohemicus]CAD9197284.1 hypothetical protein QAC21B_03455 [Acinetobacter bohemicus]
MDIKNKPTLAEKQAFWTEQLPNFEAKYWLPSHFELLEFDMEGGNYEVRNVLPEHYSEDDATEIWHRVNTGWAMWKKAINFTKAQVPESNALLSAAIDAVQKLGSGDFVLVPRVITDEWMAVYVDPVVTKYCKDYEDLPFSVEESELPEIRESHRLPIRNAHKRLMQVIEAQEQSHDSESFK